MREAASGEAAMIVETIALHKFIGDELTIAYFGFLYRNSSGIATFTSTIAWDNSFLATPTEVPSEPKAILLD